ncbi:MAG TPA: M48 family metalloprotease [Tepidisphaeraceae bacterium]|nr:M48 family metalloprotease [Tepidisphaeraceae bacterium]
MSQFYNNVKTVLLLGMLTMLILWIGSFWGRQGIIIAFIFAAISNFVSYFFSDQIALAACRAQEVSSDHPLYKVVERLVGRAGLPMPRVYISPAAAPNAFATGRNPHHAAVCATQGLLDLVDENELSGVLGHELAHVKHRDILIVSVAATIAGAISMLGTMFFWFGFGSQQDESEGNAIAGIILLLLAPIAAALIQAAISRSREFNADSGGAEICGNPMYLATALEKIEAQAQRIPMNVNPSFNSMFIMEPRNVIGGVAAMFQTHPPLEARLMNLIGRPSTRANEQ